MLNSAEYERESMRGEQEESKKVLFQASEPDSLNKHETRESRKKFFFLTNLVV